MAFLVWFSPAECLHLRNKSSTAPRETPSHCVASASRPQTENEFLHDVHKNELCVQVCKHNAKPECDSTLKVPITSVNTLYRFSSACVSATLVTGVFVALTKAHTLDTSSSSPMCLVHFWQHLLNSNDSIVCVSSLHCQHSRYVNSSGTLEHSTLQGKTIFLLVLSQLPSGDSCSYFFSKSKLCPHSVHFENTKHSLVCVGIFLCLKVSWSSHSLYLPL